MLVTAAVIAVSLALFGWAAVEAWLDWRAGERTDPHIDPWAAQMERLYEASDIAEPEYERKDQ